jgi:hypothetical protein
MRCRRAAFWQTILYGDAHNSVQDIVAELGAVDQIAGRQTTGEMDKLAWGNNKLVLAAQRADIVSY